MTLPKLVYLEALIIINLISLTVFSQPTITFTNHQAFKKAIALLDLDTAIWVATPNGIAEINKINPDQRYYDKSTSGLPGSAIKDLTRDDMGNIWIATSCGLCQYHQGNWVTFNTQNSIMQVNTVTSLYYSSLAGALWVGFSDGNVIKIDTTGWQFLIGSNGNKPGSKVYSITRDSLGNIWGGTHSSGLYKWDGTDWYCFNNLNSPVIGPVKSLAVDHTGKLWVGNYSRLVSYDGNNWAFYFNPVYTTFIEHISFDTANSLIWLSTATGLHYFNGQSFNSHPLNPLLTNIKLTYHFVDKNCLWTGMDGNGVDKVETTLVTNIPLTPKMTNQGIIAIDFDVMNHKTWFGSQSGWSGACTYNDSIWKNYSPVNSLSVTTYTTSLAVDDDSTAWVGINDDGLYSITSAATTHYSSANSGLDSDNITALAKDMNNDILIGFTNGVVQRFANNNWTLLIPALITIGRINMIEPENNTLFWVATNSAGLIRCDYLSSQEYNTTNSGIPSNKVLDVKIDALHNYWLATDSGLVKFDGVSWITFTVFNSPLPENELSSLCIGPDSAIWIGTHSSGVARFDGNTWTIFDDCSSPIASNIIYVMETGPDGRIYIGTSHGVSVIKIDNFTGQPVFETETRIKVYPNPSGNSVVFDINILPSTNSNLQIFTITGQLVFEQQLSTSNTQQSITFDCRPYPSGLYFYKFSGAFNSFGGKFLISK